MNIFVIWDDTQDGDMTEFLDHLHTVSEQFYVTAEFIDNDTFDMLALFFRHEHDTPVHTGKDTSSVNIGN